MLRKLIILLLIVAGLAGLTAGVAWYLLHDEAFLKKQAHNWFLKSTGRTLTMDGPLTLELGSEITLEASKVSLSNASWGNQTNIAEVGHLLVTANLRSLFRGKPILRNVEIDDCTVDVAENDKGVSNWNLFASDDTPPPKKNTETGLKEPVLFIDRGRANACQVMITSPNREKPLLIKVTSLAMDMQTDGTYQGHAAGVFDDYPMTLNGKLGPIRALWQGGHFDHDVKIEIGDVRLQSAGTLTDTRTLSGADISMNFTGPEFGAVVKALALPPISSGKFDFDLDLNTEGAMTQVDLDGDLGNLEAKVTGQLDRLRHPTSGNLKLEASGPNLGALAETLGVEKLIPDPFNLSLDATVTDGRSTVNSLVMSTEKDRIEVNGTIGAYPGFHRTALDITLQSDDADRWMAVLEAVSGPIGAIDAKIRLTTDATGNTAIKAVVDQAGSHLETSGGMGRFPSLDEPDFNFSFKTPNLQSSGKMFRVARLPAVPATASGRIRQDDKGLHFDDIKADLAGDQYRFGGLLTLADQFRGSRINIEADIASTARFAESIGYAGVPDQPVQLKGAVMPEGKGMTFQVRGSQLGELNISIDGHIKDFDQPALVDSSFDLSLPSLAWLDFLSADVKFPDLPVTAKGQLNSTRERVTLQAGQFSLGRTTANIEGHYAPGQNLVGSSIELTATGGDWRELLSLPKLESLPHDFRLSGAWARTSQGDQLDGIDFSLGDVNLKLNGHADNVFVLQNVTLEAQLEVPDVSAFNTLLDQKLETQAFSMKASLEGDPDLINIRNLSARLGDSDLAADLALDRRAKPKLSGSIRSEHFDYRPFQKEEPQKSATVSNAPPKSGPKEVSPAELDKVFDDTPVAALHESPIDVDLNIEVGKLDYANTSLADLKVGILWQERQLRLDPFRVRGVKGSEVSGQLLIGGQNEIPDMVLKLDGKDIRLGITSFEGQDSSTIPPVEMHIDLHGSGMTHHEMATSLDGTIRLFWGPGLYAAQNLRILFSDFITELLSTLNPLHKASDQAKLDCAVLAADVTAGKVHVSPILIQDEKITIVSEGLIDLDTEHLNLVFNTKPRTGFGLSPGVIINSLVKVGGTLASPAIELDTQSAVVTGTAAVATVGISLLARSFSDRFLSSKDPCGDARKKLAERDSNP